MLLLPVIVTEFVNTKLLKLLFPFKIAAGDAVVLFAAVRIIVPLFAASVLSAKSTSALKIVVPEEAVSFEFVSVVMLGSTNTPSNVNEIFLIVSSIIIVFPMPFIFGTFRFMNVLFSVSNEVEFCIRISSPSVIFAVASAAIMLLKIGVSIVSFFLVAAAGLSVIFDL